MARSGALPQLDVDTLQSLLMTSAPPPLLDVRAPERYRGKAEPIDPIAGHIPGARNLSSMGALQPDERFASPSALAERFAGIGPTPVVYCGSGVTASHTLLAMAVGGRDDGVLYPGSWSEWITDPNRPIGTGPE